MVASIPNPIGLVKEGGAYCLSHLREASDVRPDVNALALEFFDEADVDDRDAIRIARSAKFIQATWQRATEIISVACIIHGFGVLVGFGSWVGGGFGGPPGVPWPGGVTDCPLPGVP